jgi:hypothetical protein
MPSLTLAVPVALTVVRIVTCQTSLSFNLLLLHDLMVVTVAAFVRVRNRPKFEFHPIHWHQRFLVPCLELTFQYGRKGI